MFAVQDAPIADYRRYCVLEDQLLLAVVLQKHRVLIEGPDLAGELDPADKVNSDGCFVLPNRIQERVLNILCRLGIHGPISSYHCTQPFFDIPRQKARGRTMQQSRRAFFTLSPSMLPDKGFEH
jgi:hypothetical protein